MTGNKKENPYLSIIIFSQNDDHGDNMLRCMQVSISGLLEQLEKYSVESELTLLDCNPPADTPLSKGVVKRP